MSSRDALDLYGGLVIPRGLLADFVKLCTTAVVADKKKGIVAYDPWPLQYNTWLEVAPNYYTTLLYY